MLKLLTTRILLNILVAPKHLERRQAPLP